MSSSKIDRALYGPGWAEVVFGAVLCVALGVFLSVAYFVFKPVLTVSQLPKEPVAGQVYYVLGSASSQHDSWVKKQHALCAGQGVVLNEAELNAAAAPQTKPADVKQTGSGSSYLVPGAVNFRIADSTLQMGMPVRITSLDSTVIIQACGSFEQTDQGPRFVPKSMYVGSLPLHRFPSLAERLLNRVYVSLSVPPELSAAWSKIKEATVGRNSLSLSF